MTLNNPGAGKTIVTGNYTGNAAAARQITTGFKCSHVVVLGADNLIMVPGFARQIGAKTLTVGDIHASDGFIVDDPTDLVGNRNTLVYYYWAISE